MSPTNARALNTMRQRLKKHNQGYQEQMDAFREKPESSEEEAASGEALRLAAAAGCCVFLRDRLMPGPCSRPWV